MRGRAPISDFSRFCVHSNCSVRDPRGDSLLPSLTSVWLYIAPGPSCQAVFRHDKNKRKTLNIRFSLAAVQAVEATGKIRSIEEYKPVLFQPIIES